MDPRLSAYYTHEAGAVHRQEMLRTARAVAAGMSTEQGFKDFIRSLELNHSEADTVQDNWEMMKIQSRIQKQKRK